MATRYRKKPVEIEAEPWDGTPSGAGPIIDWINSFGTKTAVWREEPIEGIYIKTLEGEMHVSPHDFVIRGIQGEFYPCKPGIFTDSYDPV